MSTRSCIARREGDGFRGVYHHSDGYPSGLGCYIFRFIRRRFEGDAETFVNWALSHDGGWSHIFPGAVVKERKEGGEASDQARPQPQCYCHGYFAQRDGTRPGTGSGIHTSEKHGWDLEWVYVLDPEAMTMAVFKHAMTSCPDYARLNSSPLQKTPCTKLVAVVRLDGPEPDWWEMEADAFTPEHLQRRQTWVDRYLSPVEG